MYLTDEQIMLLEQLTYLTDDVADAAGVLLGPYDSVENLLQQFDDDALQRLEDPGNPDRLYRWKEMGGHHTPDQKRSGFVQSGYCE